MKRVWLRFQKRILSGEELKLMWRRFLDVFVKTKGRTSLQSVLKGLLTSTEQVMLAKRVVAGFLILSDWNAYAISETLKISTSTVYKYMDQMEHDQQYRKVLLRLLPEKIPYPMQERTASATPTLVKLLDNIFEGYTHRSKLMYG